MLNILQANTSSRYQNLKKKLFYPTVQELLTVLVKVLEGRLLKYIPHINSRKTIFNGLVGETMLVSHCL